MSAFDLSRLVVITDGEARGKVGLIRPTTTPAVNVEIDLGGSLIQKSRDQIRPFRLGETVVLQ